jgi:transglutaminase-like putative cysteine protease
MIYDITHTTEYRFNQPVNFGPHRLGFRPRDGHDMRVLATERRARQASEVAPLSGQWFGSAADYAGMSVDVQVKSR